MKIKLSIFVFVVLLSNLTIAQEYQPVKFKDYNPIWLHHVFPEDITLGTTFGFPTVGKPIIKDGNIFLLNNIFTNSTSDGYIVQKLKLTDGTVLWKDQAYFTEVKTREMATAPRLIGDQYSFLIDKEYNYIFIPAIWNQSYYGHRVYNAENGSEISYFLPDTTGIQPHLNFIETETPIGKTQNFQSKDSIYNLIHVGNSLTFRIFDKKGHRINERQITFGDTIVSRFRRGGFTFQKQNERFITFAFSSSSENKNDQIISVLEYDYNFNLFKSISIKENLPQNYYSHWMRGYTDEHFIIQSNPDDFNFPQNVTLSSFNTNGNLLEQITVENAQPSNVFAEFIEKDKTMIISISTVENEESIILIYKTDGKGNKRLVKKLSADMPNDYIFVSRLLLTEENNLVVSTVHYKKSEADKLAKNTWLHYMLIDGRDLDLISSTINDDFINFGYSINPNPTYNYMTVSLTQPFKVSYVHIFDTYGKLIVKTNFNKANTEMDISALSTGIYFISLIDNKGNQIGTTQKLVKI